MYFHQHCMQYIEYAIQYRQIVVTSTVTSFNQKIFFEDLRRIFKIYKTNLIVKRFRKLVGNY